MSFVEVGSKLLGFVDVANIPCLKMAASRYAEGSFAAVGWEWVVNGSSITQNDAKFEPRNLIWKRYSCFGKSLGRKTGLKTTPFDQT